MEEQIIVGDIHGQATQLQVLINEIGTSAGSLIFLGDYVNRGENAKAVIDVLIDLETRVRNVTFLCGNHDSAFLQYHDVGGFERFALLGGLQTLRSYLPENATGDLHTLLQRVIPQDHVQFLRRLLTYYESDTLICSHAGVPIDRPADRSCNELVFGSHPELFRARPSGRKLNICGHYPQNNLRPFQRGNFICLDTGCGTLAEGRLTALFLPEMKVLQVYQSRKVMRYYLDEK